MADAVRQLDYAARNPWHKSSRVRRIVVVATVVLVFILLATKFVPPAWRHARVVYWQDKCLNVSLPADRIVYAPDAPLSPPPARIEAWDKLHSLFYPPRRQNCVTVFVQQMKRTDGESRLVAVDLSAMPNGAVYLEVHVIKPGTVWKKAEHVWWGITPLSSYPFVLAIPRQSKIFTGQIDPGDRSHLVISCKHLAETYFIDGYLLPDDTLLLEPRRQ